MGVKLTAVVLNLWVATPLSRLWNVHCSIVHVHMEACGQHSLSSSVTLRLPLQISLPLNLELSDSARLVAAPTQPLCSRDCHPSFGEARGKLKERFHALNPRDPLSLSFWFWGNRLAPLHPGKLNSSLYAFNARTFPVEPCPSTPPRFPLDSSILAIRRMAPCFDLWFKTCTASCKTAPYPGMVIHTDNFITQELQQERYYYELRAAWAIEQALI